MAPPAIMGRVARAALSVADLPLNVLIGMAVPSPIVLRQSNVSETKDHPQAKPNNSARSHSQLPPFQNLFIKKVDADFESVDSLSQKSRSVCAQTHICK